MGLDLSLQSPGMSLWNTEKNTWHLFGFAQKKSQIGFDKMLQPNVRVKLFDRIPECKKACDAARYRHIVNNFMSVIDPKEISKVQIEAYAYPSASQAGYNFKLHELGGVIKLALYSKGITEVESVVSSSWKKQVVGVGNATKWQTIHHVRETVVDLMSLFDGTDETKEVPCPWQDLADATCLAKYRQKQCQEAVVKNSPAKKRKTI